MLKRNKNPNEISSYRPIILLPLISKVFEMIRLKRVESIITEKKLPTFPFGFGKQHSTIKQVHRVIKIEESSLKNRSYCIAAFLGVSIGMAQSHHIENQDTLSYYRYVFFFSRPYLIAFSKWNTKTLIALYFPHIPTSNMLIAENTTIIMAVHSDPTIVSQMLQNHLTKLNIWCKLWKATVSLSLSL